MRMPVKKQPDTLTIKADNFFHAGWIAGVLGEPLPDFDDVNSPTRDEDCDAWRDGWEMASESGFELVTDTIRRMQDLGQLKIECVQEGNANETS